MGQFSVEKPALEGQFSVEINTFVVIFSTGSIKTIIMPALA